MGLQKRKRKPTTKSNSFETSSVPKLAIIGSIEIAPGRRDQLLALLMAHRARCLKDESGTLQFEVSAPYEKETKVLLYEVYQDDAAFDLHRDGPSIAQWREETAGMMVKICVTRCALVN
jgi:quinol monooxygenase YgiN